MKKMANTTEQVITGISQADAVREATQTDEAGEGYRLYMGRVLDELPGVVFAAMTLVWIFTSFGKLIW
jgi:hypothetical protein